MRTMERNKQPFHYALYLGQVPVLDGAGNRTGEHQPKYGGTFTLRASISPATGYAQTELFGTAEQYDKVIVVDDLSCPIDENTVLFIDRLPEYDENDVPLHDYIVRRVAKSLNFIAYAVSKVKTS